MKTKSYIDNTIKNNIWKEIVEIILKNGKSVTKVILIKITGSKVLF